MTDKNYEILEHIAVLSENASGWKKELTLTKWFDNEPKYDIRDWSTDKVPYIISYRFILKKRYKYGKLVR